MLLNKLFHITYLFTQLLILLLLEDQILNKKFSVVTLCSVFALQLSVFLTKGPIFIVNPLSNVGDQLQFASVFFLLAHQRGLISLLLEDFVANISINLSDLAFIFAC